MILTLYALTTLQVDIHLSDGYQPVKLLASVQSHSNNNEPVRSKDGDINPFCLYALTTLQVDIHLSDGYQPVKLLVLVRSHSNNNEPVMSEDRRY